MRYERELIILFMANNFISNKDVQQLREYFLSVIQLCVNETEGQNAFMLYHERPQSTEQF